MKLRILLVLFFLASIIYAQIPTSGLKAYYELDNVSTTDFLGLDDLVQTGTATMATTNRFGSVNTAVSLNGDSFSRGNIIYSSAYNDFSISLWIKTTTNSSDYKTIIYDIGGSSFTVGNSVYLQDGVVKFRLRYYLGANGPINTTANSVYIADGNWHHIVVTSDQLRGKIYTDGILSNSSGNNNATAYVNRLADSNGNIFIAQNSTGALAVNNKYQDGLDDILFYDKVLTVTEIENIGNNGGFCFPPTDADLSVSTVTETSADFNWTNSGTYDIAYGLSSDAFATYTQVNGVVGNTYALTNLTSSSTYTVYIRQQCSATQNSDWNTFSFASDGPAYVDVNAAGNNTGSSFANAYTDLNTALANHPGKEIWIAAGTYIPTQAGITDRNYSFDIPASTKLYGGFDGTETMLSERDPKTNITILSGDINGDDDGVLAHENPLYNDNSYQIVTITEDNVVLDGLTIKGGNANGTIVNGAALAFNESVVTLDVNNVIFEDNRVSQAGIIYATNNGVGDSFAHVFNFESCIIRNNIGNHSTAMYIVNPYTINTLTTNISNTLIYGNEVRDTATDSGVNSLLWFRNDISRSNIAYFYNCTITKNRFYGTNTQDAGVITSSRANTANGQSQVYLYNSIVWDNLVLGLSEQVSIDKWGTLATPGSVQIKNSIGADNFSNWSPTNSVNTNPLFTDATNNDFTLQATSPAVDTGDNSLTTKVLDLAGNNRIFNTTVDTGVYEFGSLPPLQRTLVLTALNGTITVDIEPTAGTYNDNTEVTLTAVPDSGYEFNGWSGDANQTAISTKVTMDVDKNVTALFRLIETPSPCSGTVVIPDTLFKSILVNNASINTNGDSEISCSEASAYTGSIASFGNNVSGSITDLTGIEAFINVTKLDFPDHDISIMDLSKNKVLTYLRVSYNNLTTLDVSENRLLTTLICYGNNNLEFLNVANFNNTNFVAFDALYNQSLTCIQVDDVTYSTANWTSKDARASFSHDCMYTFTQSLTTIATNGTISVNVPPTNGVYNRGDIIELTATPANGYQFEGWSGDASGTANPLSVTMDADKNVTAMFSAIQRTLTITRISVSGGVSLSVSPNTISGDDYTFDDGTVVTLNVVPNVGYQFDGWSGDASGTANPLSVTIDADKSIIANYSAIQRTLATTATNGTITTSVPQTNGTYDYGTVVELTATPNAGYQFDGWSGDATGTINPLSVTMYADKNITAMFSQIERALTLVATNGAIMSSGIPNSSSGNVQMHDDGDVVSLTALPDTNYQFNGWSGDATGTTNPLSVTMYADKTITAMFGLVQQTLTTTSTNGTVSTDIQPTNGTYDYGTVVELMATPDAGYQFDGWTGDATGTANPLSVNMDSDKNIVATFSLIKRALVLTSTDGFISVDVPATNSIYDNGTVVALTATPDAGYVFDGWSGDLSGTTNPISITMDADKSVTALFSLISIERTLAVSLPRDGSGVVTRDVQPTNGTYSDGTVIELTAVPTTGYQFDRWSGDLSDTTNPISITMDADKSVTPMFSALATASITDESFNNTVTVFPNPVVDILKIVIVNSQELEKVEVFNLLGKKVLRTKSNSLDFGVFPSGIYVLKIENSEGKIAVRKIIKK